MFIIRSSKNPEFRKLVEEFQLRAEDLSAVEGEEHAYQLLARSMADMPAEMIAVVKFYTTTYEAIVAHRHGGPIAYVSGPIALWMSKGCRRTPENKLLVAIVTSKPLKTPQDDTPIEDSLSKGSLVTPTPQSNSTVHAKKLSLVPEELSESLKEEAEIVIETAMEGNKPLILDTADILVVDGNEFIAVKKGGIGTISSLYRGLGANQEEGKRAEPSAPV